MDRDLSSAQAPLEQTVGNLLLKHKLTIAFAESCTGGLVSNLVTDVSGSSNYFLGSIVCYSNQVKMNVLKVPRNIIDKFGAVSKETADKMSYGVKTMMQANIGVGITGIAGPGGATTVKPIGLVYISIDGPLGTYCYENVFSGTRKDIKKNSAFAALEYIRCYLCRLKFEEEPL